MGLTGAHGSASEREAKGDLSAEEEVTRWRCADGSIGWGSLPQAEECHHWGDRGTGEWAVPGVPRRRHAAKSSI